MTRIEIHDNFIRFMEKARKDCDYSIQDMADYIGVSVGTYKNMIYGKTECIDISIACKLYDLTGAYMWQMVGYSEHESDVINIYSKLSERDKRMIKGIAELMNHEM